MQRIFEAVFEIGEFLGPVALTVSRLLPVGLGDFFFFSKSPFSWAVIARFFFKVRRGGLSFGIEWTRLRNFHGEWLGQRRAWFGIVCSMLPRVGSGLKRGSGTVGIIEV